MIGAQQAAMGIEPPSPYEINNKYLEMEYKEMEAYVNQQREKWKTYGCTIMSDGWTGPTELSVFNFMVYSKGNTVFLKSVDASNHIKDNKYIYELLKTIIKEVGQDNVVQIVTDIGKRPSVIDVINNARKITNFIYNHGWLLAQMRKYCGGDIVRPGATRCGVGSDLELLQAFVLFQDAKRGFGDRAAITARSTMVPIKVECVLSKEVHSESFSKDTDDSVQTALNSHQEIDSTSASHSSRRSAAGTSASGYDGSRGGTDDGGDNAGGDIYECQHSQYPINQFTYENDFTHCTHDEDHGFRRASPGIGAIGKPYRGRKRTMEPYNEELLSGSFEFMSIGTQYSDSSNEANVYPPHVMSYSNLQVQSMKSMVCRVVPLPNKCHTKFHIRWKEDLALTHG
ncbi:hypothetical protein CK203_058201 [Vitis vinifera]|uniref:DUF659 domain-containing protein n=1 Tax=Vitis vinifera TaxID=29760 RepID=A0A438GQE2_VITVI|nr:hypothetical protein CK203_058201 [Vitis vinifera]